MTPVVIGNIAIVLLDTQKPSAQNFIIDMKAFYKIEIQKHPQAGLMKTD